MRMCSNISMDTTRSKRPAGAQSLTSAVRAVTLSSPNSLARASMNPPWAAEFDSATTRLDGWRRAAHRANAPQPQPRSRMRMPSSMPARAAVSSSIELSAAARSATPGGQ